MYLLSAPAHWHSSFQKEDQGKLAPTGCSAGAWSKPLRLGEELALSKHTKEDTKDLELPHPTAAGQARLTIHLAPPYFGSCAVSITSEGRIYRAAGLGVADVHDLRFQPYYPSCWCLCTSDQPAAWSTLKNHLLFISLISLLRLALPIFFGLIHPAV